MRYLRIAPRGIPAVLIALLVFLATAVPALAAGAVQDDANMLSAAARSSAESKSAAIQRDTGKSVTVKTVANLGGKDVSAAGDQFFQQQKLNGVLLYIARDEKKFKITIGTDTRQAISTTEEGAIRDQMTQRFAANDFDGGVLNAMDRIGTDIRAAVPARTGNQPTTAPAAAKSSSGFPVILVVLLVLAVVGVGLFFLLRRRGTPSGPSGGYGANVGPSGGYNQGGYGPGYGQNYGGQGGGGGNVAGSIIGGAAAGIGGAIVGNAIYDHFRDHDDTTSGNQNSGPVGDYGASGDDAGRVSDSGQDVGSWGGGDSSTGDWGSSGDSGGSSDSGGGGDPGD